MIRINSKDGLAVMYAKEIRWWYHPEDDLVDVAVTAWKPQFNDLDFRCVTTDICFNEHVKKDANIGTGNEVFITGLFSRFTGASKNHPIVRMGNIAMMPDEKIPTKGGDRDAYLIEARSIGGVSGSPVFVREDIKIGKTRHWLLGLVHGHWDLPPGNKNDNLVSDSEQSEAVNMGIAIVIPAEKILEVINQPKLAEKRKRDERECKPSSNLTES